MYLFEGLKKIILNGWSYFRELPLSKLLLCKKLSYEIQTHILQTVVSHSVVLDFEKNVSAYFLRAPHVELDLGVDQVVWPVEQGRVIVLPQVVDGLLELPSPESEVGHQVGVVRGEAQVGVHLSVVI